MKLIHLCIKFRWEHGRVTNIGWNKGKKEKIQAKGEKSAEPKDKELSTPMEFPQIQQVQRYSFFSTKFHISISLEETIYTCVSVYVCKWVCFDLIFNTFFFSNIIFQYGSSYHVTSGITEV